jgi:hypothetical protein
MSHESETLLGQMLKVVYSIFFLYRLGINFLLYHLLRYSDKKKQARQQ